MEGADFCAMMRLKASSSRIPSTSGMQRIRFVFTAMTVVTFCCFRKMHTASVWSLKIICTSMSFTDMAITPSQKKNRKLLCFMHIPCLGYVKQHWHFCFFISFFDDRDSFALSHVSHCPFPCFPARERPVDYPHLPEIRYTLHLHC